MSGIKFYNLGLYIAAGLLGFFWATVPLLFVLIKSAPFPGGILIAFEIVIAVVVIALIIYTVRLDYKRKSTTNEAPYRILLLPYIIIIATSLADILTEPGSFALFIPLQLQRVMFPIGLAICAIGLPLLISQIKKNRLHTAQKFSQFSGYFALLQLGVTILNWIAGE